MAKNWLRYSSKKKKRKKKKLPKKSIGIELLDGPRNIECSRTITARNLPLLVFMHLEFNNEKNILGRR
jgi:hypothetical protein